MSSEGNLLILMSSDRMFMIRGVILVILMSLERSFMIRDVIVVTIVFFGSDFVDLG